MSGTLFPPADFDASLTPMIDPLLCFICQCSYTNPRILNCFHSYCAQCLVNNTENGAVTCPMCGIVTRIKDSDSLPPQDEVINFLLSSRIDDVIPCANCDRSEAPMYFCQTCHQPLCVTCKDVTHSARMFQSHIVIPHSESVKPQHIHCATHNEPYILYSRQQHAMLCINCFRDMPVERRSYCIDIDTAYHEGRDKLGRSVHSMRERQASVQASVAHLHTLLGDIRVNTDREKEAIHGLHGNLVDKLENKKSDLLSGCDRQYEEKGSVFKQELHKLSTILPTLHTNLSTSTIFTTSANKHEFLQLSHLLVSRLKALTKQDLSQVSTYNSVISSDYKTHFARCLEAVLFPFNHQHNPATPLRVSCNNTHTTPDSSTRLDMSTSTSNQVTFLPATGRRSNAMAVTVRFIDAKSLFAEHCVQFRESHSELTTKTENLKTSVQEVYRDLTMRRVYAKCSLVNTCQEQTDVVQGLLVEHRDHLLHQQASLQKHWEESIERISNEQELYQAQINDVNRLQSECRHLRTIVRKLSPFVMSINSVTDRLLPNFGDECNGRGGPHQALLDTINMITPDSQHRVDAIEALQEERLQMSANRTNPLDGELIKQKGLLRAPGERLGRGQRDSRTKSAEICDMGTRTKSAETCDVERDDGVNGVMGESVDVDGHMENACDFLYTSSVCNDIEAE